jgi:TonB family protein
MNVNLQIIAARAALAFGLASALPAQAATMPHQFRSVANQRLAWVVVRVGVDARGHVRSKRVVWQSADRDFRDNALAAAGKTTFTPNAGPGRANATFDYLLESTRGAGRSARIVSTLSPSHGIQRPAFHVSARDDAWSTTSSSMRNPR